MRPETTYNNSGKSSYANFEIGPGLNKPYVQFVKQQVKKHNRKEANNMVNTEHINMA